MKRIIKIARDLRASDLWQCYDHLYHKGAEHELDGQTSMAKSSRRSLNQDRKEIRLLCVHLPPYAERNQTLQCTTTYTTLLDAEHTSYVAISYSWGNTAAYKPIELDGSELMVPESAIAAIRGVCRFSSTAQSALWLDAICINQHDLDEKSQQVAIMGEIYAKADRVLVWLGDDDGLTASARRTMYVIAGECLQATNNGRNMREHLDSKSGSELIAPYAARPLPARCDWHAFFSLFAAPWFSRLWVMQEVVLARTARCIRGDITIAMHTIQVALQWLSHRLTMHSTLMTTMFTDITDTVGSFGWMNTSSLAWLLGKRSTQWLPLYVLLQVAASRGTTEPRDKIFGLLGLLDGPMHTSEEVKHLLRPDYRKPVKEVYADAAFAAMLADGSIKVLEIAQHAQTLAKDMAGDLSELPSWVPTLVQTFSSGGSPLAGGVSAHFCAHNNTKAQFARNSRKPNILEVGGLIVDRVVQSDIAFEGVKNPERHAAVSLIGTYEWVADLVGTKQLPGSSQFMNTVASTMVAGAYDVDTDASRLLPDFCAFVLHTIDMARQQSSNPLQRLSAFELNAAVKRLRDISNSGHGDKDKFESTMMANPMSRAYIRTSQGLLGAACSAARPGDVVCILLGASSPFLLRKCNKAHWELLRTVYVHGIMQGQYVEHLQQSGRHEAETIVLKIC